MFNRRTLFLLGALSAGLALHAIYGTLFMWRFTGVDTSSRTNSRVMNGEQMRRTIQKLARQAGLRQVRTAWKKDEQGGRLMVMLQTGGDAAVLPFLRACEALQREGVRPTLFRLGKVAVAEGDGTEGLRGLLVLSFGP